MKWLFWTLILMAVTIVMAKPDVTYFVPSGDGIDIRSEALVDGGYAILKSNSYCEYKTGRVRVDNSWNEIVQKLLYSDGHTEIAMPPFGISLRINSWGNEVISVTVSNNSIRSIALSFAEITKVSWGSKAISWKRLNGQACPRDRHQKQGDTMIMLPGNRATFEVIGVSPRTSEFFVRARNLHCSQDTIEAIVIRQEMLDWRKSDLAKLIKVENVQPDQVVDDIATNQTDQTDSAMSASATDDLDFFSREVIRLLEKEYPGLGGAEVSPELSQACKGVVDTISALFYDAELGVDYVAYLTSKNGDPGRTAEHLLDRTDPKNNDDEEFVKMLQPGVSLGVAYHPDKKLFLLVGKKK